MSKGDITFCNGGCVWGGACIFGFVYFIFGVYEMS